MNQVLLLTANPSADKQLKENLEYLGYEVLHSTQLVEPLMLAKTPFVLDLPVVIFSETLPSETVETILRQGQIVNCVILRCDTDLLNDELYEEWQKLGLTAKFSTGISLSSLRELLSSSRQLHFREIRSCPPNRHKMTNDSYNLAISTFSKKERQLFEILFDEKKGFLTRKEVAQRMWNGQTTSSHLAQLSQIVSRIRLKFARYGFTEQIIETHWKKGYKISDEIKIFNNIG
ncbi:winged helix-turn-helix domain-containing protein [Enterococcus sp. HY326]|uniref:winged helix-turn-helix domain-containing protein n=1 Tax=Enterococcus sp. HY326 TaxID=2971265 RepID=UPI002240CF2C|nr:winged helix-turn-helix domain-containing protein [Enterococcus sp. HY326]